MLSRELELERLIRIHTAIRRASGMAAWADKEPTPIAAHHFNARKVYHTMRG